MRFLPLQYLCIAIFTIYTIFNLSTILFYYVAIIIIHERSHICIYLIWFYTNLRRGLCMLMFVHLLPGKLLALGSSFCSLTHDKCCLKGYFFSFQIIMIKLIFQRKQRTYWFLDFLWTIPTIPDQKEINISWYVNNIMYWVSHSKLKEYLIQ